MFSCLKNVSEIQNNKVCLGFHKKSFHSTPPVQMFSRVSSPARRYGMVFGAGWAASRFYDKTTVSGSIKVNNEGVQESFGSISHGGTTINGQYNVTEGVSGSIKVEKQSFYSDMKIDLINCTSNINESTISLDPNTEFLIQISLVFGLILELSIIGILIGFFYKYGFKEGYLTIKKKFEEVKKPVVPALEHLFLFVIFLWVCAIDNAQTNLIELSFSQTDGIKELYKAVLELQNSA